MFVMIRGASWNAFLALIPLVAAYAMALVARRAEKSGGRRSGLAIAVLGLVWLAFLPNTCYLMTEWRHFLFDARFKDAREAVDPNSLDVLRIALHAACFGLYSGFGVICFAMAIRPVGDVLRRRGLRPSRWAAPFFLATSLGVYLGLIARLNSWDLALRPAYVARVAAGAMLRPSLLAVVVAFAGLLWVAYLAVDVWIAGLNARMARSRMIRLPLHAEKYRIVPR